jgi:hypothetical protein
LKSSRHGWRPLILGCRFRLPVYDFDRSQYVLELMGQGREGRVWFSREFLDDVRDNKTPAGSRYVGEVQFEGRTLRIEPRFGMPSLMRRLTTIWGVRLVDSKGLPKSQACFRHIIDF